MRNKYSAFLTLIGLVSFVLNACQPSSPLVSKTVHDYPDRVDIQIVPDQTFQTIEGFGVSGAWWAQEVGGWQPKNRKQIIDLLFDPVNGIGLNTYRYYIGAGGGAEIQDRWRKSESFEITLGIYNWQRDSNAVRILKEAYAAGADQLIAFAYSPPPRLTRSGMVSGAVDGRSNLGFNKEDAFAKYLVDIASHLISDTGIPIGWISPVNEPQIQWSAANGQEGSYYSPDEVTKLTIALLKRIDASGLKLKVLVPESANWSDLPRFFNVLLQRPELSSSLDVISVHSYDSSPEEKAAVLNSIKGQTNHLRIWMTEWVEMESGRDLGMKSALSLADTIHDDLTLGGVSSWQYWIAVSKYDYHDGLLYITSGTQTYNDTKRLWALGNFSKFIRPGSKRISTQLNKPGLKVSAYLASDQNSITIVAINPMMEPIEARILISKKNWLHLSAFSTSEQHNLAQVYTGSLPNRYTFPGLSITTLIISP